MRPALLLLWITLFPIGVQAAGSTPKALASQLAKAKSPKARALAAQQLGASADATVVPALCRALADASDLVRIASAQALGSLKQPEGLTCLRERLGHETGKARPELEKAIASFEPQAPTKLAVYISLATPLAQKDFLNADQLQQAEKLLRARLEELGAVIAPAEETNEAAKAVLTERKLKGYRLEVRLEPLEADGMKLAVLCLTYPERTLRGQLSEKASGGEPAELIEALAPRAIDDAAETFGWRR